MSDLQITKLSFLKTFSGIIRHFTVKGFPVDILGGGRIGRRVVMELNPLRKVVFQDFS